MLRTINAMVLLYIVMMITPSTSVTLLVYRETGGNNPLTGQATFDDLVIRKKAEMEENGDGG